MEKTFIGKFFVLFSIICVSWATASLSPKALRCICEVESKCEENIGCKNMSKQPVEFDCEEELGCNPDLDSLLSCGPYGITENYWIECGKPGDSFRACANAMWCAEKCIQRYMARWAELCTLFTHTPTDMDMIRIHHGGPTGCQTYSTLKYWHKVKPCCVTGTHTCSITEGEDSEWQGDEEDMEEVADMGDGALAFATDRAGKLSGCGCVWLVSLLAGVLCSGLWL